MDIKEFEYKLNQLIYEQSAIEINQLIGTSKTSTASIGLYLNVPIKVTARKIDSLPEVDSKRQKLIHYTTAYLKHDDQSCIQFACFYETKKDLTKIYKAAEKHTYYLTYLYLREIFRLMRNHNTKAYYEMMKKRIKAHSSEVPVEQYYSYILVASDYSINNYLYQLFKNSFLSNKLDKIFEFENYNSSYNNMAEIEILLAALELDGFKLTSHTLEDGTEIQFSTLGNTAHWVGFADYSLKDNDEIVTDLGESLSNHLKTCSRGLGSSEIFASAIEATKTKTGWFKKLVKNFEETVYYATNKHYSSWANINTTYRHKFKAPKHVHQKSSLNIYLSVDHSGSMSDEELGKLLYLISKHSKRISKLTVWVHDTEIVKEYVIQSADIKSDPEFLKAFKERVACGGTSHKCIADKLIEIDPDPEKSIYMSFSDNQSDIPQAWARYSKLAKLPTYWVCTIDNPIPDSTPGTNITVE